MVGEFDASFDASIDQLQIWFLPGVVRLVSAPLLRIDPWWDPIRNQPSFQKMIENNEL